MSRSLALGLCIAAAVLSACGGDEPTASEPAPAESQAAHIHGLGINPADQALLVATHSGMFRAAPGSTRASRVGDSAQDTMGFTVIGPDRFLGSGHPDIEGLGKGEPPLLGLIRSDDAGRNWSTVSLRGAADFHVLRPAGTRIFGFNASDGRLLVSDDQGRTWGRRTPPGPLLDLAVRPSDPDTVVAAADNGVYLSPDAGKGWRPLTRDVTGLLAWPAPETLVLITPSGEVRRSDDDGRTWDEIGDLGGQPAALTAVGADLYAATHTNEVKVSRDGGRTWRVRAAIT